MYFLKKDDTEADVASEPPHVPEPESVIVPAKATTSREKSTLRPKTSPKEHLLSQQVPSPGSYKTESIFKFFKPLTTTPNNTSCMHKIRLILSLFVGDLEAVE